LNTKNKLIINIITPFPGMFEKVINEGILLKSQQKDLVKFNFYNLFEFLSNPKDRIDDYPFGGGEGMILRAEPIFNAIKDINERLGDTRVIFPTPDGKVFNQEIANKLAKENSLTFICGHYKGIDQRIRDNYVDDEYSVGDFVLTNGELPTMLILDSIVRLRLGVLNNYESALKDSFSSELLDGPHYTRPRVFHEVKVPDVLLSGNHKEIEKWFLKKREDKTKNKRKDLWKKYKSTNKIGDKNG
tara:strand:- start:199 stop:930 length:732 start_codon:yes stop_codon:yes gene_type:complete